jgi:hypothetical protein
VLPEAGPSLSKENRRNRVLSFNRGIVSKKSRLTTIQQPSSNSNRSATSWRNSAASPSRALHNSRWIPARSRPRELTASLLFRWSRWIAPRVDEGRGRDEDFSAPPPHRSRRALLTHLGIRPVSQLNTWPVVSPVNASRRPSRGPETYGPRTTCYNRFVR